MTGDNDDTPTTERLQATEALPGSAPSTLVDPFVHYADRSAQILLRENARLVSNSEIQTFKRCRRKWWLAWFRGLRAKNDRGTGPRAIGDRVHRALSYWYRPSTVDGGRIDPLTALNMLIEGDLKQLMVSDLYKSLETSGQAALLKEWKKDADLERAMMEGYIQWLEETGVDSDLDIIESEQYLDARLPVPNEDPSYPVYIIAKLDARVRRVSDGVRLFIDHKTVAAFAPKVAASAANEQFLLYHLIEYLNSVEERCDGALLNMIRRVKRTAAAKPPFFQRHIIWHNVHQLASLRHRIIGVIGDIINVEWKLRSDHNWKPAHYQFVYPTPTEACAWDCDFASICPRFDDGSRVEDMISQYFVKGDPLSYYLVDRSLTTKEE